MTHGHVGHYTASRSNSTDDDVQQMDGNLGWLSPITTPPPQLPMSSATVKMNISPDQLKVKSKSKELLSENDNDECIEEFKELDDSLSDYCTELFGWWWKNDEIPNVHKVRLDILNKLDECHANEVVLIFKAIRSRNPSLVPHLQEYILDKGNHFRLVSLLAHMYQ